MTLEAVQSLAHKNLNKDDAQACPLCGQAHPIVFPGITIAGNILTIHKDKGYSFCNCNNIFFTDWKNMEQQVYDEEYYRKYQFHNDKDLVDSIKLYADFYFPIFETLNNSIQSFLEVGAIHDILLDEAKKKKWNTVGVDIFEHPSKHIQWVTDFEIIKSENILLKFDVIWASHVFEHFKDPLKMILNCHEFLNADGLLYIAMPDPWFINHSVIKQYPGTWPHFHIQEHHILWDMDSFIDRVLERGFELSYSKRNGSLDFQTHGDYHLIFKKI